MNQRAYLRRISDNASTPTTGFLDWNVAKNVFAAEVPQTGRSNKTGLAPDSNGDEKLIGVLQDERSDVASKLDAIDRLNARDDDALKKDLQLHMGEPLALTIFDLTQHSDIELSTKSTVLAKRMDIDGYLVDQLSSDEKARRESAEKILLRISRVHAQAILRRVDVTKHEDLKTVSQDVASGLKTQILKPTPSAQGDRYYVKATWNPSDQQGVKCLAQLFNTQLESARTIDQEQELMQGKNQRFVFWYSKDWAIQVSQGIRLCGGNSEFVHPY